MALWRVAPPASWISPPASIRSARLPNGLDEQHITPLAAARGLEVRPLSAYVLHRLQPPGLVLGFATMPAQTMAQAVQRLAEVIRAARGHRMREATCF